MKYMKPTFDVTEFQLNESIATCPTTDTYNPVTVSCVISGTHAIFYGNCDSNYNDLTIVTYNGKQYLVWANTNSGGGNPGGGSGKNSLGVSTFAGGGSNQGGNDNDNGSSLLQAILQAGEDAGILPTGGTDDASNNWGSYHAGPITPDITSTRNSSL